MELVGCVHTMGAIPSLKGSVYHDIRSFFFFSFSLSLSLRLALPRSLPPCACPSCLRMYLWSTYLSAYQPPLFFLTGCSHLFVRCREGVALFLDFDEMRIGCRMWKRSGTNEGMVQGQSTKTKPHWAGCRCCICGGSYTATLDIPAAAGPLGFARARGLGAWGLGLGSGRLADLRGECGL